MKNEVRVELKVCEGCGALWLRAGAIAGVYCKRCVKVLAEFPAAKGRRSGRLARGPRHGVANVAQPVVAGGAR